MSNQITPNPSVPSQVVAEVTFPKFINNLGIIPTSYKDSMSYYECLAWLCKYLEETVIPSVNQNGMAVQELQNLYIELNSYVTNYFDNLDVQEEINNKLDAMVEAGTLQEIIYDYLNTQAIFCYDNVEDMTDAENLIAGSHAKTLGFHAKNDGGTALYNIRNITNSDVIDNITIIPMTNSDILIAELIIENEMNVEQFGAYGDNEHDDTNSIQIAINNSNKLCFSQKTYKVSVAEFNGSAIEIPSNRIIEGNQALISLEPNNFENYKIIHIPVSSNVIINNLNVEGDLDTHTGLTGALGECINIGSSTDIYINNCKFTKAWGDCMRITGYEESKNININNCYFDESGRNGISVENAKDSIISNCTFGTFIKNSPHMAIDVEPFDEDQEIKNLLISDCILNCGMSVVFMLDTGGNDITINNIIAKTGTNNESLNLINDSPNNKIYVNNCNIERLAMVQNDKTNGSFIKAKNINILSKSRASQTYRNSGIYIDLSGEISASEVPSGFYNVELEATVHGEGSFAPYWCNSYLTKEFSNNQFTLLFLGNFVNGPQGYNSLNESIADFVIKPSVFVPAESHWTLNNIHTIMNDKNSVMGGAKQFDYVYKNVKTTIIAGSSAITPVIGNEHSTGLSFEYLDGLNSAVIPAGEQRCFQRIGSKVYVSLT